MWARAIVLLLVAAVASVSWLATCALVHFREVAAGIAPLDPRSFAELTLVTVGTGGPYENPNRGGPCSAVGYGGRLVLVDAGRAVAEGLRAASIPVRQPDTVFLTHLLPENVVGLDDLLATGWLNDRERPLRLIGPPGTRELADSLLRAHTPALQALASTLELPLEGAHFEVLEIDDGWSEEGDGLAVRAAALGGGPVPARAYRFEAAARSLVVSGTGWDADALVALATGADLLVHEGLHGASVEMAIEAGNEQPERLRREAALHTHTDRVGALAQRAGVRTLVLVRLRPPPLYARQFRSLVGQSFRGRVVVAEDGEEITP